MRVAEAAAAGGVECVLGAAPRYPPGGQDARWVGVVADSVERESPFGWLSRHNAAGTTQLLTGGPWVGYVFRQMAAHDTPAARVGYVFRQMAAHGPLPARVGYVFRQMAAHGPLPARVGYVFRQMAAHDTPAGPGWVRLPTHGGTRHPGGPGWVRLPTHGGTRPSVGATPRQTSTPTSTGSPPTSRSIRQPDPRRTTGAGH